MSQGRAAAGLAWLELVFAFAFAWAVFPSTVHAAQYGFVTIDLRPEVGEVPTELCVASSVKGPRASKKLSELLDEDLGDGRFRMKGSVDACESGECGPVVQLPQAGRTGQAGQAGQAAASELFVACAQDSLLTSEVAEPRRLILLIEHLEGSPPAVESLKLAGGVATIGVNAKLDRVVVTARSLGGHYQAHARAFRAEANRADAKLIVLPVSPRCHRVELDVPGTRLREADQNRLHVRAHGRDVVPACVSPLRGRSRIEVRVPRAHTEGTVEVEIDHVAGQDETGSTRLSAQWQGAWPKGRLEMVPTQLAFAWRRPACIYPAGQCPAVTLEGGIECKATSTADGCSYLCPGGEEGGVVELETPITATFRDSDPAQTWTAILQRPGQTLADYVSQDEIRLDADISSWVKGVPGSRITHVEILGTDGSVRRYGVSKVEALRLHVPRAGCDPLRYRLVGDRRYVEAAAKVADGKVDFGRANRTARLLTFNVLIAQGGGPALTINGPSELSDPVYFAGLVQLAANFRPRRPKLSRLAFELRLGGSIGQYGYFDDTSLGDDPRRVRRKIAWGRFIFEPAVIVDVVHPLALSFGLGIGSSWSINPGEQDFTNRSDDLNLILSPSIGARFNVRRWLSFVLQGRGVFLEETGVAVLTEGGASFERRFFDNVSLMGLYGVVLSF